MCGTPLAFMPTDQTKTEITVGSLDQPIALAPVEQIGIESRLPWTSTLLELPAKKRHKKIMLYQSISSIISIPITK
ncbi:unnamed protein product, partial [Rotaria sp. Silwood1]